MYNPDCLQIADWASKKPENLFRVGLFAQCTINQHLEYVPKMMQKYDRYGFDIRSLGAPKERAVRTLLNEQERLFDVTVYQDIPLVSRLQAWVEMPGFGIVKAGFVLQLMGYNIGCLDRHNLRLAGLRNKFFTRVPTSATGLTARLNTYLTLCKTLGGTDVLWDKWCTHVSQIRPKVFPTPDSVSKLHVQCIVR
jgi:hypothetical protein